mmetsp:Transcript_4610/g.6005  ORF Transcript_4610/g.6005 Transcript_4610/m.6005 type:complete len:199 (-) Transcript_4610:348-944(-)|eukprot:CAMPEP_0198142824 /NCGR_PEP_ID=MMETSP1443-20131203/5511_1 /TAXON_ID=186043 /ORGANISM="Entomoneis sp., Strain CCMP2396" /LENGTH=198 /DNA_ID=CAMNT_0043805923 /DNA_START=47 /DNA_END=643 /DNA_ORIENTATION=-
MKSLFVSILFLFVLCRAASANMPVEFHGVSLPKLKQVDGLATTLNGHGLRKFSFYGVNMNMYVAGLYSRDILRNESEVMQADGPLCIDFVFLRAVSQGRMRLAWNYQMDVSVSHFYDGYDKDKKTFMDILGGLDKMGVQSVQLVGNDTEIIEQGKVKGNILGSDFQKAFLSMLFGEQAINPDLKAGLLGGHPQSPVAA